MADQEVEVCERCASIEKIVMRASFSSNPDDKCQAWKDLIAQGKGERRVKFTDLPNVHERRGGPDRRKHKEHPYTTAHGERVYTRMGLDQEPDRRMLLPEAPT